MTEVPAALALIVSLIILGSIWSWALAFAKLAAGRPLLAFEPRTQARWSLLEVFITVMLWITFQGLAGVVLERTYSARDDTTAANATTTATEVQEQETQERVTQEQESQEQESQEQESNERKSQEPKSQDEPPSDRAVDLVFNRWLLVLSGVGSLVACGMGGLLIVIRTGGSWGTDLGLTLRQAGRDVSYGVVAYVMLAPIVGAIQLLMQYWYPSEHPLIEKFRANPTLDFYLVCVFAAAIVAPTVEEFLCRVLVQGWLERVFAARSIKHALLPESVQDDLSYTAHGTPDSATGIAAAPEDGERDRAPSRPPSGMPIIISALLFAAMHWPHGADRVPLFVLALGLGYLYQRTHRILPCVVLHFLVNAFALVVMAMSL